jgi:hypothetical protein
MRCRSLLWIALFPGFLAAQEHPLSVTWHGMEIRFVTKVEPAGSGPVRFPGAVIPALGVTHRVITDSANRREFGYDLLLESVVDGQTMQLTFRPLHLPPSVQIESGYRLLSPREFPVVPVMHVGDTVALDLLVNPATGQKVVDYLSLYRAGPDGARGHKTARDFPISDVELNLDQPRVWVNGKLVEDSAQSSGGIVAHVLALYLSEDGAFVISLWPEPGLEFQKAGVLQGNTLTFRIGSSEYRVESGSRIAPGPGLYNVYVHHDPTWGHGGSEPRFMIGGADKAAWLIRRR